MATNGDYEQLAVTTGAVKAITAAIYTTAGSTAGPAQTALLQVVSGGPIRVTVDGTTPSSTVGMRMVAGGTGLETFELRSPGEIQRCQMIAETNGTVAVLVRGRNG